MNVGPDVLGQRSPLSGSGVAHLLIRMFPSSAGLALLLFTVLLPLLLLCSIILTRARDRLMKSGLKSSRASWDGVGVVRGEDPERAACLLMGKSSATL